MLLTVKCGTEEGFTLLIIYIDSILSVRISVLPGPVHTKKDNYSIKEFYTNELI